MEKSRYIPIMIQSLKKKEEVLDNIIRINQRQKEELDNPSLDPDDFDATFAEKEKLIDQLDTLDSGFQELFEKIRGRIGPGDFTEEIYHRAAEILFAQYEADGAVNPAGIVSIFEKEEDQREIAAIFHARVPDEMTKEDRKKAMRETVLRVKENSIRQRSQALAPDDMEGMMQLIADKRALEQLERMDQT